MRVLYARTSLLIALCCIVKTPKNKNKVKTPRKRRRSSAIAAPASSWYKSFQDWHACAECILANGGRWPEGPNIGTVMAGKCFNCGKERTLIPLCDFNWPKEKIKAIWD